MHSPKMALNKTQSAKPITGITETVTMVGYHWYQWYIYTWGDADGRVVKVLDSQPRDRGL